MKSTVNLRPSTLPVGLCVCNEVRTVVVGAVFLPIITQMQNICRIPIMMQAWRDLGQK